MVTYFNEIDAFAAQWLRNLYPAATVDERSIHDVQASDLVGFDRVHFFGGIGGWELALQLAGWTGPVWTGSCPCQPYSAAGRRKGHADERNLWPEMFRLIRECRPSIVLGEQVERAIAHGWIDMVFDDLEAEGYACGQVVLPACSVGDRHIRQRIWRVANLTPKGLPNSERQSEDAKQQRIRPVTDDAIEPGWRERWQAEPGVGRVVHGVRPGNPCVAAIGNAIVPEVAAVFIRAVMEAKEGVA